MYQTGVTAYEPDNQRNQQDNDYDNQHVRQAVILCPCIFSSVWGITRGYSLGHEVFSPTAVAEAPGTDKEFTIRNGESLSEVAEELEKAG